MTKITLLYLKEDYANFTQGAITCLVLPHFDLVEYQPGESYNTMIKQVLAWSPPDSLELGLKQTYQWIEQQLNAQA